MCLVLRLVVFLLISEMGFVLNMYICDGCSGVGM